MKKILISTDSSCLINKDCLKKTKINIFPLNVIIDGEEFLDGVTINQEQLSDAMRSGKKIKTSTPPLGDIVEYFEKLFKKGYEHIIHFTISSKLSSMYQLFCNVAKENFEGKLTIIDAYGVSSTMLSHVFYAYEEVSKGTDIDTIVKNIEKRKKKDYLTFIPENLVALRNGGRISPAVAVIGDVIGIKPVINLLDGELKKECMVRNVKKTIKEKIDKFVLELSPDKYDYTIISFDANEQVLTSILDYTTEKTNVEKAIHGIFPINVSAHCGPGTIGFAVSEKINGKSLREFI